MSAFFSHTPLTAGATARVAPLNTIFAALSAAFDMLPTEDQIKLGLTQYGTDAGTVNNCAVALPYPVSSYTDGMVVCFKPNYSNTSTTVTLNVDSVGGQNVKTQDGSLPAVGRLKVGYFTTVRYNMSHNNWEIQN